MIDIKQFIHNTTSRNSPKTDNDSKNAYKYKGTTYPDIVYRPWLNEAQQRGKGRIPKAQINAKIPVKTKVRMINELQKYDTIKPGTIDYMANRKMFYEHDDRGLYGRVNTAAYYTRYGQKTHPIKQQIPTIAIIPSGIPGRELDFFHELGHAKEDEARINKGLPDVLTLQKGWKHTKNPEPSGFKEIKPGTREWINPTITTAEGPEARAEHFKDRMKKQIYKRGVDVVEVTGSTDGIKSYYEDKAKRLKELDAQTTPEEKQAFKELQELNPDINSRNDKIWSSRPFVDKYKKIHPSDQDVNTRWSRHTGWFGTGVYGYDTKEKAEADAKRRNNFVMELEVTKPFKTIGPFSSKQLHEGSKHLYRKEYDEAQRKLELAGLPVTKKELQYAVRTSRRMNEQPINSILRKKGYTGVIPSEEFQDREFGSVLHTNKPIDSPTRPLTPEEEERKKEWMKEKHDYGIKKLKEKLNRPLRKADDLMLWRNEDRTKVELYDDPYYTNKFDKQALILEAKKYPDTHLNDTDDYNEAFALKNFEELTGDNTSNNAYIGFGNLEQKKQVDLMENVFNANPRLKFKRDKSITDIYAQEERDSPASFTRNKYNDGTTEGILKISPSINTKAGTTEILEHELTHATDAAKLGEKFWDINKKRSELTRTAPHGFTIPPNPKIGEPHTYIPLTEHFYDPEEIKAQAQAGELLGTPKGREIRAFKKQYPTFMTDIKTELETSLQTSPKLKDMPTVWRDDNSQNDIYHNVGIGKREWPLHHLTDSRRTELVNEMLYGDEPILKDNSGQNFKPIRNASEVTAARRFGTQNIQRMPKLGSGRDRNVYQLEPDKVLKIAKNPLGLQQNEAEKNLVFEDFLNQYEHGKDYVVMEKADKPGKATKQLLKPLQKFYPPDYKQGGTPELIDAMSKAGLDYARNYNLAFNDFKASRNWGEKSGVPIPIDGGIFDDSTIEHPAEDWSKKEWREVQTQRSIFRNKGKREPTPLEQYPYMDTTEHPEALAQFTNLTRDETSNNMTKPRIAKVYDDPLKELLARTKPLTISPSRTVPPQEITKAQIEARKNYNSPEVKDLLDKTLTDLKLNIDDLPLPPEDIFNKGNFTPEVRDPEKTEKAKKAFDDFWNPKKDETSHDAKQVYLYKRNIYGDKYYYDHNNHTDILVKQIPYFRPRGFSPDNPKELETLTRGIGLLESQEMVPKDINKRELNKVKGYWPSDNGRPSIFRIGDKLFPKASDRVLANRVTPELSAKAKELLSMSDEELLRDKDSNNMAIVYHGTDKLKRHFILKDGLKTANELKVEHEKEFPGMDIDNSMSKHTDPNKTYFFKDPTDAINWAKVVSSQSGIKPAVITADIPDEELERDIMMHGTALKKVGGVPAEKLAEYPLSKKDSKIPKIRKEDMHIIRGKE